MAEGRGYHVHLELHVPVKKTWNREYIEACIKKKLQELSTLAEGFGGTGEWRITPEGEPALIPGYESDTEAL